MHNLRVTFLSLFQTLVRRVATALLLFQPLFSHSQSLARYPVIQCPEEHSVILAWRTKSMTRGRVAFGTDSLSLQDTSHHDLLSKKHEHKISRLSPDTRYYYQVISSDGAQSKVEHFYTAKPEQKRSLSFLVYGDCGYDSKIQHELAAQMEKEAVDFAIVTGDVDQGVGIAYDRVFFGVYKDMLKRDCHYTCLGNHDMLFNGGRTYLNEFCLPKNNPDSTERYYSFEWGHAKFICLDTNIPYKPASPQYKWLVRELENADHDWLFVFFHHPPWTNSWGIMYKYPVSPYFRYRGTKKVRKHLVPLFEKYKVDFVLNGHAHSYQRGTLNGVQYLITGGAGDSSLDFHCHDKSPNISVERYQHHYVRFDLQDSQASYKAIDKYGHTLDSLSTTKKPTR